MPLPIQPRILRCPQIVQFVGERIIRVSVLERFKSCVESVTYWSFAEVNRPVCQRVAVGTA